MGVLAALGHGQPGCASSPASSAGAATLEVVAADAGDVLFRGPATYTMRGAAEHAVAVPGLGELQVGVAGDAEACRFVWARDGLDALVVYGAPSAACAQRTERGLCFADARFARPAGAQHASLPGSLVVRGCAQENDLLWGRLDGATPATVGPRSWRKRCVRVRPVKRTCALTYLRKESIVVETNAAAEDGFTFVWDGDGWRGCFLEAASGRYALRISVEDSCGGSRTLTLAGDSADLDD
jgi:hypothetical protein